MVVSNQLDREFPLPVVRSGEPALDGLDDVHALHHLRLAEVFPLRQPSQAVARQVAQAA